jgi:hypothetical protein
MAKLRKQRILLNRINQMVAASTKQQKLLQGLCNLKIFPAKALISFQTQFNTRRVIYLHTSQLLIKCQEPWKA